MTSPETGICAACSQINMRTDSFCSFCGVKLPWADTASAGTPSPGSAPLSPTTQRVGLLQPSAGSPSWDDTHPLAATPQQNLVPTYKSGQIWGTALMVIGFVVSLCCLLFTDMSAAAEARAQEVGRTTADMKIDGIVIGTVIMTAGFCSYRMSLWSPPRLVPPEKKVSLPREALIKILQILIGWWLLLAFNNR